MVLFGWVSGNISDEIALLASQVVFDLREIFGLTKRVPVIALICAELFSRELEISIDSIASCIWKNSRKEG
jgi:hypothetical protein